MAASLNLSATRINLGAKNYAASATGIQEGAVVVADTDGDNVKLPAGAAANRVSGVCMSQTDPTSGTAVGDRIDVQKAGQAAVLLVAGGTVATGDELIIANSSGHVKAKTSETGVTIVGRAEAAHTAGASAEMIPCWLTLNYSN